jgi:polyferredoxin
MSKFQYHTNAQFYRKTLQFVFLITTIIIGYKFYLFASQLENGMVPDITRPPGVEAFLPISALVSLKYFMLTGTVNDIHPSGMIIFLIICSIAIFFKKSFCSWICPFGLFSDYLLKVHFLIFKQGLTPPKWLDIILRSIKYVLLGFFLWSIGVKMNLFMLKGFIYSSYNIVADIKMLKFFTDISQTALVVILLILILSIFIKNFWCRYLCPYGALLGGLSIFSIFKIRREDDFCTRCTKCDRVCPSDISISQSKNVISDECNSCMKCLDVCPEKDALSFSLMQNRLLLKPAALAVILLVLFVGTSSVASYTGHWHNNVSGKDYLSHMVDQGLIDFKKIMSSGSDSEKMERAKVLMEIMMKGKSGKEK